MSARRLNSSVHGAACVTSVCTRHRYLYLKYMSLTSNKMMRITLGPRLPKILLFTKITYYFAVFLCVFQPGLSMFVGGIHIAGLWPMMARRVEDPNDFAMNIDENYQGLVTSENIVDLIQRGITEPIVHYECMVPDGRHQIHDLFDYHTANFWIYMGTGFFYGNVCVPPRKDFVEVVIFFTSSTIFPSKNFLRVVFHPLLGNFYASCPNLCPGKSTKSASDRARLVCPRPLFGSGTLTLQCSSYILSSSSPLQSRSSPQGSQAGTTRKQTKCTR